MARRAGTLRTGTGRIRGRVLLRDPARRSGARRSGSDGPDVAGQDRDHRRRRPLRVPRPAGRPVHASAPPRPATSPCSTGRRGRSSQGKPIELADKQALDKADIVMPRGSVDHRADRRRVRRAGGRRDGHRAASAVDRRPAPPASTPAASARPTTSASSGSTACRRATTTSAPRCGTPTPMMVDMMGAGRGATAPHAVRAGVRLRADLLPGHAPRRPTRRRSRSPPARKRRASTFRSPRCVSPASAASS